MPVITPAGITRVQVLVVMRQATREVHLATVCNNPDAVLMRSATSHADHKAAVSGANRATTWTRFDITAKAATSPPTAATALPPTPCDGQTHPPPGTPGVRTG